MHSGEPVLHPHHLPLAQTAQTAVLPDILQGIRRLVHLRDSRHAPLPGGELQPVVLRETHRLASVRRSQIGQLLLLLLLQQPQHCEDVLVKLRSFGILSPRERIHNGTLLSGDGG